MEFLKDTRDQEYSSFIHLLYSGIKSIISKLYYPTSSASFDGRNLNSYPAPRPLRNIELNCYLNSAFQSIAACPKFVYEMKKLETVYPTSKNLIVFNRILAALSDSSKESLSLPSNEIVSSWNRDGEQDTFELLSHIIFQVFNELKKVKQNDCSNQLSNVTEDLLPLNISMVFKMKCSSDHSSTEMIQTDLAIHLPIPFRVIAEELSMEKLMDNYFIEEEITDSKCINPHCEGQLSKFVTLKKPLPSTLCIHLQRSYWNSSTGTMQKNNERVTFSEKLIIKGKYFSLTRNTKLTHGFLFRTFNSLINDTDFSVDKVENADNKLIGEITAFVSRDETKEHELCIDSQIVSNLNDVQRDIYCNGEINAGVVNGVYHGENVVPCYGSIDMDSNKSFHEASNMDKNDIVNELESEVITIIDNDEPNQFNCTIKSRCNKLSEENVEQGDAYHKYDDEEYHLKSVIVHFGNPESGHYICHRKCGERWFCTNDSFVREVTLREVLNSEAYILMYEKD